MIKKSKKIHPVKSFAGGKRKSKILFNRVKFPSELRFDLVSKDWVIIATGRGKRPEGLKRKNGKK